MKRITSLLMALVMMVTVLFSCSNQGNNNEATTTTSIEETTVDLFDDDVPDNLDYNGYEFVMAFPNPADNALDYQIGVEGNVATAIDSAVYKRNLLIEERFNITLSGITAGNSDTQVAALAPLVLSDDDAFDIAMIAFTFSGIPWMTSGYALPWNDVEHIDLSRDYWSQSMTDNIAVNGYNFLIQGKINWTSAMSTQVCFFNTNVATNYGIEDLYAAVENNTWTFDKCKTIARSVAKDLNNDGTYDENDQYGIIQSFFGGIYNWSIAADYTTVLSTSDGLVLNYETEKFANIVEYCYDLLYNHGTSYVERFDYVQNSEGAKIFFDDRALFMFTDLGHGDYFRNEESDYGIIPCPKYDEAQEKYCTTNDQWGLSCALPSSASDTARTGAITEALCALSAKLVYPTYYDVVLSERNTRDEKSKQMLDLIFSNVVYDVGITLAVLDTYIPLCKLLDERKPSSDLSSWVAKYSSKIQVQYDKLFDYVKDNYS